jgi:outer membrane immunogenic protein
VRILAGAIGLMVGVGLVPALAADLSTSLFKAPPAGPPPFSWIGCYVGVEGGGAWGQSQHVAATAPRPANVGLPITLRFNLAGALAGGTVGCNYQVGNVVLGVENDMSWTNKGASSPDMPPFSRGAISSTNEKWIDTLRGRVGWAWDRFLVYGTGGAAFAGVDVSACSPTAICVSDSRTRTGWSAGVGGEWAVWSVPAGAATLKIEYLHADFGAGLLSARPSWSGGILSPAGM